MKYLKNWSHYNNINENKIINIKYNTILDEIKNYIKNDFLDINADVYFITKDINEKRISIAIKDIKYIPYSDEYIKLIKKKQYYIEENKKYNKEFNQFKNDLDKFIKSKKYELFDIIIKPTCKDEIYKKL